MFLKSGRGGAGPSRPKSPRIENSLLENLRASLKEEITSEIKNLLIESQKEMLELLKPKTRENIRDNFDEETENETRNFYTPTKSVRINSTQNDPNISRNMDQILCERRRRFPDNSLHSDFMILKTVTRNVWCDGLYFFSGVDQDQYSVNFDLKRR